MPLVVHKLEKVCKSSLVNQWRATASYGGEWGRATDGAACRRGVMWTPIRVEYTQGRAVKSTRSAVNPPSVLSEMGWISMMHQESEMACPRFPLARWSGGLCG